MVAEKQCLQDCLSPFLCRLEATFQDGVYAKLLLEFVPGGSLFAHLHEHGEAEGGLGEAAARFYVANAFLGVSHLHDNGYCYRGLKPENLLVNSNGYLKIVNLGLCKKLGASESTFTFCGTPEYMAPEIVLGAGYNRGCDYWSLGILLFELFCGSGPFCSGSNDDTFQRIARFHAGDLNWPSATTKAPAKLKDLVFRLLQPHPGNRLGVLKNGAQGVRNHHFFGQVPNWSWKKLYLQKDFPSPPWIPDADFVPSADSQKMDMDVMQGGQYDYWSEFDMVGK